LGIAGGTLEGNAGDRTRFLEKNKYNPSLKLAYNIAKIIEELFIFDD